MAAQRLLWLAVLAVCLTLPLDTHEFDFGFSNDNGDGADNDEAAAAVKATVAKRLAPRRATERKFKFHKLERMQDDNENEQDDNGANDDEDNDLDSEEEQEREQEQQQRQQRSDYEDDETAVSRRNTKRKAAKKGSKQRKSSQDEDGQSLMGWLMAATFGRSANEGADEQPGDSNNNNNIIHWLQWLGARLGYGQAQQDTQAAPDAPEQFSWLAYLQRWPFNSLFPQPEAGSEAKSKARRGATEAASEAEADDNYAQRRPMSQEYLELLMHSLPAFVVNVSQVEQSSECRQQLELLHRQLRAHSLWTLQMLDATGKISSGLLRGNINQLGDFELCTQLRAKVKATPEQPGQPVRIRGKYCLAHIELQARAAALRKPLHLAHGRGLWHGHLADPRHFAPRYSVANWGVCVPSACDASVVRDMLARSLRPYNDTGLQFQVQVQDEDCTVQQPQGFLRLLRRHNKLALTVLAIGALGSIVVASVLREHWSWLAEQAQRLRQSSGSVEEAPRPQPPAWTLLMQLLEAFSPQSTWRTLTSLERPDIAFPLVHLLKLAATLALYASLKFVMAGHLPLTDRDRLVAAVEQRWSVVFRAPMLYSDALLLVSGFLAAHQLAHEMEQRAQINLLKSLATKAGRYLPTVGVVLALQTWLLPHLDAGPLWQTLVGQNARLCEQQMWRSAFSVQNAVDFEQACSPLTLQLAVDVQLYVLGPLIVWLYSTDAEAGFFVYGACHAVSAAMRYSRTRRDHLAPTLLHGLNVSKFYRSANLLYTAPISRATAYLLGLGAGLLYRREGGTLAVSRRLVPVGWTLAALSVLWCFWSASAGMLGDSVYSASEAAAYAAWSPLILGLALSWCILMFPRRAPALPWRLARPLLVLSRIAFPLQLATYVVVLWNTASIKQPIMFDASHLFNVQELGCIVALGMGLAFLIDVPAQQLRRPLIERIFMERIAPAVSAEPERTAEGEQSEAIAADTPEPADTIWASDPEEEEQKYIARRYSSVDAQAATAQVTEPATKEEENKNDEEEEEEEEQEQEA